MKIILLLAALVLGMACLAPKAVADFVVRPTGETVPFAGNETADDTAIWLHPTDPAMSLIIAGNKSSSDAQRGIHAYDLGGNLVGSVLGSQQNNIDLRYGFSLGGETVDIVASTNRTTKSIDLFTIDPLRRTLEPAGSIPSGLTDPYGLTLWNDRENDKFFAFISNNDSAGSIRQFELFDNGGSIGGRLVRFWSLGSLVEGLAADDFRGNLFVGQEDIGIWQYGADPSAGTGTADRTAVGQGSGEVLAGDVEGLAIFDIFDTENQQGYLLASEQGNNSFAILERYDHDGDGNTFEYVGRFTIGSGGGVDGVNDTDGISVLSSGLGSDYPAGMFLAQDGSEDSGGQNNKLVSWANIVAAAGASGLTLATDPDFDPRNPIAALESVATGLWHAAATWHDGEIVPNEEYQTTVHGHTVTVASDARAKALLMDHSVGSVVVGPGNRLDVVESIELTDGTLDVQGAVATRDLLVDGGIVRLQDQGTIQTQTARLSGGTVNTGPSQITVHESLMIGQTAFQTSGTPFDVSGPNLADKAQPSRFVLRGGTLSIRPPLHGSDAVALPGKVLLVSDEPLGGSDDTMVTLLESLGHEVNTSGMGGAYGSALFPFDDPGKVAALEEADLVLVSRMTGSGSYTTDRLAWNELETPLVLMNGYLMQAGALDKWGWTAAGSSNANKAEDSMVIAEGAENHPFVDGLSSPVRLFDWTTTDNLAPSSVYLPNADTPYDSTQVIGTFDGRPYLLDIPAGFDLDPGLATHYGTTGAGRVFLGQWRYKDRDLGSLLTDDFRKLFANVLLDTGDIYVPGTLTMDRADFLVTDDTTLHLDSHTSATLGDVSIDGGVRLTLSGAPLVRIDSLRGGAGSTLEGARVAIHGVLSPGDSVGPFVVEGNLAMESGSAYVADLGALAADSVRVTGDVTLDPGSALQLDIRGDSTFEAGTYTLIQSSGYTGIGDTGIVGQFGSVTPLGAYVEGDGLVYSEDSVVLVINRDLHPADADLSGSTDLTDFNIWNKYKFTSGTTWQEGDFDGNGVTDLSDFNIWNRHKFTVAAARITTVPEPASAVLLIVALIVLAWARRRT